MGSKRSLLSIVKIDIDTRKHKYSAKMNIIQFLAKQFRSKRVGETQYIDMKPIIDSYKSFRGKSKTSIKSFINDNNLEYIITRFNDDRVIDLNIDQFHHKSHHVLVSAESIKKIKNFIKLLEKNYETEMNALEQLVEPSEQVESSEISEIVSPESEPSEISEPKSAKVKSSDVSELVKPESKYNIIDLTDEEKFRDSDNNIVEIDVRGTRDENGILFRASDISEYLGMDHLIRVLRNDNFGYEKNVHWLRLYQYSDGIYTARIGNESSVINSIKTPEWARTYLTLSGLIKVIFSSKSANENLIHLHNWIIKLVFTHQFGSSDERIDLAMDLVSLRTNLNDKRYRRYPDACGISPGLYCIKIGNVKQLREAMNISTDLYPAKEFDTACVYKFGRAEDIMSRFAQHSTRAGYGQYGKISLDWFVTIPKAFLPKAENDLAKYFKSTGLMFEYNDGSKDHKELIIAKPGLERTQLKEKYKEMVSNFPSNINEISKQLVAVRAEYEHRLETVELKSENKILVIQSTCEKQLLSERSEHDKQLSDIEKQLLSERSEHDKQLLSERSEHDRKIFELEKNQMNLEMTILKLTHQVEMLKLNPS